MSDQMSSLRQLQHHSKESIRFYHNHESDDYPAHWHMTWQIIMPQENCYQVVVENESYVLQPGEVIIIPSGVVHELLAPQQGSRTIIMVDRSQIASLQGMSAVEHCFYPCVAVYAGSIYSWQLCQRIRAYVDNAVHEDLRSGLLAAAAVRIQVQMLLLDMARSIMSSRIDEPGLERGRSQKQLLFGDVTSYLSVHCGEQLQVQQVAARCGYSRNHFERLFRTYTGMTFHDYLLRQRINLCKRLLASCSDPVTDIAMRSGFGSIATFNRVFRSVQGVTPTQFRSMLQGPLKPDPTIPAKGV